MRYLIVPRGRVKNQIFFNRAVFFAPLSCEISLFFAAFAQITLNDQRGAIARRERY
jgi:hypothetical protein